MMKSTGMKASALFAAIVGSATWAAVSVVPSKSSPSTETDQAPAVRPYKAVPGMVVTYTDGYAGGTEDDGKGSITYKEPYEPTVFVTTLVDGRPERARNGKGDYYGWTVAIPSACSKKAKAAVGHRMSIGVREVEDGSGNHLDDSTVSKVICG